MSKNQDRAEVVRQLLLDYEAIDAELVMRKLRCGHGQALRAIRQGRALAAEDAYLVSYANPNNAFTVAADGDESDRTRSWIARQRSINTQKKNAAHVMGAGAERIDADAYTRALAKFAKASAKESEVERIRLDAIAELMNSHGPDA